MRRDLRRYAQQTKLQLGIGFILLLFIVGVGLIYIFFGPESAMMGLICLFVGLGPVLLIGLSLWLIGEFVKRNREE
jgi:hypothetical protein